MKHEPNRDLSRKSEGAPQSINVNCSRRYLLISPCRDEARYLRRTLDSVALQSVPPALWIVVDDGSTDETLAILEDYAKRLPYLRVIRREDRGVRKVGPGVIEAFYAGLEQVQLDDFDYVCKLDMDLDLPIRYFEVLIERMEANPRLGTTSGKPWFIHPRSGRLVPEVCGDEMSVGMTKFYRTACFNEIGGFVRQVMWDGIDCHRARMLGWIAESVDLEPIRFVHLRPQGASQNGILTGRLRAGFGQYFMGTSPLYYLAVAGFRLTAHPALIGSMAMLWGYLRSWIKGLPRYDDPEFRRFLRSYQHACLRMGKRAATARVNAERSYVWQKNHPAIHQEVASAKSRQRAELMGLKFDTVTIEAAVEHCLALCQSPRLSNTVITANSSHLCMMRRDPELASACRAGDLIVADGMSVVWALRASGQHIPERVAGIDLMSRLLDAAAKHRLRVYFLGAKSEVVSTLVQQCLVQHPGIVIAGFRDGYFGPPEHPGIIEEIRVSNAHMLFVGMPTPFKETWVEHHRERLQVPVIVGVGGSFDVLAGFVRRAPYWVQMAGMEWFWRLMMEPRKLWKRYLTLNSEFSFVAGLEVLARRLGRPPIQQDQE
ncbi:MAG: WecB/TagA/CpsF family glycosyltransferase [Xanthobacteraceae bacterium]|nr:WecB/TagA/CpsF family glycosyltransferase [Xanthobacteraceae bacterium]